MYLFLHCLSPSSLQSQDFSSKFGLWFARSSARSFVRSFICSCVRAFVSLSSLSFTHSFLCSHIKSSVLTLVCSFDPFARSFAGSTCSFTSITNRGYSPTWFWAFPFIRDMSTKRDRNMRDWYTYSWCSISLLMVFPPRIISLKEKTKQHENTVFP